jgi:hypothetical protein
MAVAPEASGGQSSCVNSKRRCSSSASSCEFLIKARRVTEKAVKELRTPPRSPLDVLQSGGH